YFEPLDREAVAAVAKTERVAGAVVQFGGQTAVNLADPLSQEGVRILGSSVDAIDLAEDRRRFAAALEAIGVPQPVGDTTTSVEEALAIADRVGYPVVVRPSYVLGGRAMEIVRDAVGLRHYMEWARAALPEGGSAPPSRRPGEALPPADPPRPRGSVLVDKYLMGVEVEVDTVSDGETVLIPGIMQHVERAGVHSGDSYAVYPAPGLESWEQADVVGHTIRIARHLDLRGLVNVQYVVH